jgi:hypothetical protein
MAKIYDCDTAPFNCPFIFGGSCRDNCGLGVDADAMPDMGEFIEAEEYSSYEAKMDKHAYHGE